MLKKFSVKNYKNFKDEISIDFTKIAGYQFSLDCITDGFIGKMLIYGRNATGKTNFGRALMDIKTVVMGGATFQRDERNADSDKDTMEFSYEFLFDETELIYRYARLSNKELQREELSIDGNIIYRCDFAQGIYDYNNLAFIDADTANIERYLGAIDVTEDESGLVESRLPFFRWLINNVAFNKQSILLEMSDYIKRMNMITVGNSIFYSLKGIHDRFLDSLDNREKMQDLEDFLNAMGIECRLVLEKLPDGKKELYFEHEKLVPFYSNASSGTLALVDLYRRIVSKGQDSSLIYLDEFDAFYHYEMSEKVVKFFKEHYPKCQMIMTTHNTNLMMNRLMRPDCMFILSQGGTLTALCDATERELREGHNLEKMYISGEFERYE